MDDNYGALHPARQVNQAMPASAGLVSIALSLYMGLMNDMQSRFTPQTAQDDDAPGFWSRVSPRRAYADLRDMLVGDQAHKGRFLLVAAGVTASILLFFTLNASGFRITPQRPEVTYIDLPPLNETPEQREVRQALKAIENERARQRAARNQEEVRDRYRQLGRRFGMDVDGK